jgi:hypothetical protein
MSRRAVVVGVAFLLALAGCSHESDEMARSRESPQAVFNTLLTALEKGDFETVVACLDPDVVAEAAALAAWRGLQERDDVEAQWRKPTPDEGRPHRDRPERLSPQEEEAKRKREEKRRRRAELLDKHGLTKEASDDLRKLPDVEAARKDVAKRLRDPAGFYLGFIQAYPTKREPEWVREGWPRPRLDAVAFDGDKAAGKFYFRAVVKGKPPVQEISWPISFVRRTEGDWRVADVSLLDFVGIERHLYYKY